MGILAGKKALIVGVASKLSIAAGIAEAFHREGAEIALTYQNERLKSRVEGFAEQWDSKHVFPCDVADDAEVEAVFTELAKVWDGLDILVHSVGFAPGNELAGNYADVATREGFRIAHDISSYSLTALAKAARPMMRDRNGSVLTLTYLGAQQVLPNYNVMGLAKASLEANVRYLAASLGAEGTRVNGISAGPIKTLAAAGIGNFRKMLAENAGRAPLKRNVTTAEVGNAAAFLGSDMASGVTGEILYVDAGFSRVAMAPMES
ncbi:enoyl-ACP reductase FabI [Hydrocarboniclastica marina]|uniref:Enoyl-[acyl-carrier-protein] reductase [NADH] n=1 Tax=Hydrocarboniclastica marina TaxID=2259620 RepID=A0A4P7XGQ2_9ALTE|nr:enoyl-ACP reductase [Hydrocarboniclastica marina]MAL96873.1 enoyl-[acyl-carrier-protein] reductase FabI [Alteromonadaceae bacterium]QCF26191.1 SDR family NAD(P)-dependent oxidoreductase [Hydrocarboniclastica marina]